MQGSPPTTEQIEALLTEISNQIPDSRTVGRRSAGISIVASVLAAGIWWATINPRPDPWTATQASAVNSRQDAVIQKLRDKLEQAERNLFKLSLRFEELSRHHNIVDASLRRHQNQPQVHTHDNNRRE